jgi:serine/threonine protein kinase
MIIMNKLYINIHHSNLQIYEINKEYEITAIKSIGNGGYGYIFLTNQYDVIKIIPENPNESKDNYSDFTEENVIKKIIDNKSNFNINNNKYAIGKVLNKNNILEENNKTINPIDFKINAPEMKENQIKYSSIITNRKKQNFVIYETNTVLIMPYYLCFYNYIEIFPNRKQFKSEQIILFFLSKLIQSIDELLTINIINIDIKMNNIMFDKKMDMKIIDFGLTKSFTNLFAKIETDFKYYVWSNNQEFTYNNQLCYMLSIFALELIFDKRITDIQNNPESIKYILYDFMVQQNISSELKKLVKESINFGTDYQMYKEEIHKRMQIYDWEDFTIPNIYNLYLLSKREF